jgi:hypothetical protein
VNWCNGSFLALIETEARMMPASSQTRSRHDRRYHHSQEFCDCLLWLDATLQMQVLRLKTGEGKLHSAVVTVGQGVTSATYRPVLRGPAPTVLHSAIWERSFYSSAGRKTGLPRQLLLNGPLVGFFS